MISYRYGSEKVGLNPEKRETENEKFWRNVPSHDRRNAMAPKKKVYKTKAKKTKKGPWEQ